MRRVYDRLSIVKATLTVGEQGKDQGDDEHDQWVMVLAEGHKLGFYTSPDLKEWTYRSSFERSDLGIIVFLGVVQIGLAYTLFTRGIERGVRSLDAGLVGYVEPLSNPFWVYLFLGERPSAWALLGGAVIIAAVALHAIKSRRP